jgi:large subunit ribosomal protein L30
MAKKSKIKITLKKSVIGRKPQHVKTVRALGLKKLNGSVEKEVSPSILGMVRSISHMISVEEIK